LEILPFIPENTIDMIFADPPYMLSNGGFTCFHNEWISACRRILKPEGTIWISVT
jgi:site-specific DNA-methyltransferase (adenine-specific)